MELLRQDPTARAKVFEDLLGHLRRGYSVDCFAALSKQAIEELLKTCPEEFVEEDLAQAHREGKANWEELGYRQAAGSCLGNSRTWYYNMSNRYGWREKSEVEAKHSGGVQVEIVSYASKQALQAPMDTKAT